jgi:hypothetical protein
MDEQFPVRAKSFFCDSKSIFQSVSIGRTNKFWRSIWYPLRSHCLWTLDAPHSPARFSCRVARWFYFQTQIFWCLRLKNDDLFNDHLEFSWTFLYHLEHFVFIWYIFPLLVPHTKKKSGNPDFLEPLFLLSWALLLETNFNNRGIYMEAWKRRKLKFYVVWPNLL